MKVTVLVDNQAGCGLQGEWGLSVLVEQGQTRVLLDAGATDLFAENARALGIDLGSVQAAVLSHAHFDHAGGMRAFFGANDHAPFYVQESCGEDCYAEHPEKGLEYIGVPKGVLGEHADRVARAGEKVQVAPGFWLLGHSTPGLEEVGRASHMLVGEPGCLRPDDFAHEQSLVVELESGGIAVLNSCCHAGADVVVREAQRAWPDQPVRAVVGGFHLYETPEPEVRAFAQRLRETGVELVVTGHCTGPEALGVLTQELGQDVVCPLSCGLAFEL
ncbi:MAG: MBL fold metallo-hydrolase [Coriobacteriia bacterium]|nr:MBL fold metallo-hydrolase [Coriobacteriia bacterium]